MKSQKRLPKSVRTRANKVKIAVARRSPRVSGEQTTPGRREDILAAAAELFAMHGYHGVSVRDIANRAGVPIALCGYYFGKKSELFMALFEQNSQHSQQRILEIRKVIGGAPTKTSMPLLIRAWAEPLLRMRDDPSGAAFAILIARALWDPAEEAQAAIRKYYDPVASAFLDALSLIYPDHDQADLTWAYEWAVGALLMHIADRRVERISKANVVSGDFSKLDGLIAFICAGMNSIPSKSHRRGR